MPDTKIAALKDLEKDMGSKQGTCVAMDEGYEFYATNDKELPAINLTSTTTTLLTLNP